MFPRFHQWDLVTLLVETAAVEGPGHCYLVQHSAGSGKSNSIAWAAHQLSSLHRAAGEKMFHSVIVIADEAHSSQTGSTARKVREVLTAEQREGDDDTEISAEDMILQALESRRGSKNLSYFAFTATPKARTMELFGRLPDPTRPPAKDNLPQAFHVYSMRQAIEEKFILDVLRNYTSYSTAYKLAQQNSAADEEVNRKKARKELGIWIKLHPHNIGQRVQVIVEHFRKHVQHLLGGQAKAMVVTSSRVEAVRYKLAFDTYIARLGYRDLHAMVAFSGEVVDPESADFPLTERNLNPDLKQATDLLKRAKQSGDAVLIANAESEQRDAKGRKDSLDLFKKDLGTFARFYEFGSGKSREKELEPLSLIIARMNDLFAAEHLSDADLVSYAETIAAKVRENSHVMAQVRNNTAEQTMLGDFPKAVEDAVLASGDAHHELMTRYLANKAVQTGFARLLLEMLCKPA